MWPPGKFLLPHPVDELVQTLSDSASWPPVDFLTHNLLVFLQPHTVTDQAAKPPGETPASLRRDCGSAGACSGQAAGGTCTFV